MKDNGIFLKGSIDGFKIDMSISRKSGSSTAYSYIPNLGWNRAVISDRSGTRTVDVSNQTLISISASTNNVQNDSCTMTLYVN